MVPADPVLSPPRRPGSGTSARGRRAKAPPPGLPAAPGPPSAWSTARSRLEAPPPGALGAPGPGAAWSTARSRLEAPPPGVLGAPGPGAAWSTARSRLEAPPPGVLGAPGPGAAWSTARSRLEAPPPGVLGGSRAPIRVVDRADVDHAQAARPRRRTVAARYALPTRHRQATRGPGVADSGLAPPEHPLPVRAPMTASSAHPARQ